jgi:hypothetical protein
MFQKIFFETQFQSVLERICISITQDHVFKNKQYDHQRIDQ